MTVAAVKHMMFGFGDDTAPLDETVELMEDLVVEYVHAMVRVGSVGAPSVVPARLYQALHR